MPSKASESMRLRTLATLAQARKIRGLLENLHWGQEVETAFFARRARSLPKPEYRIDRGATKASLAELLALRPHLRGDGALPRLLRNVTGSVIATHRMLLAVETPAFYELSCRQYGGARSMSLDADSTNLDLAHHIERRLSNLRFPPPAEAPKLTAQAFIDRLKARLAADHPKLKVRFEIDAGISAKVMAGTTRVRVRADATFGELETEGLWLHEVETHALTGQNGRAQKRLPFLSSGGPRSTRTQEGLAVFSELYGRTLGVERLRRLVTRVELVAMVEGGANFLEVYRRGVAEGQTQREAYLDAMRIFRGASLTGGAPFTKDACYLSGLAETYNFLRICMTRGAMELAEVLVSGRLALDDLADLVELRREGWVERPLHLPLWLENWDGLVAYFAFTSFLNEIDLPPLEKRFARVNRLVSRAQSLR